MKTTIKNINITSERNLIISLTFLKIVERAIRQNMKLIFLDESSILSANNNYRIWRQKEEDVFFQIPKKERVNLVMAISEDEVLHYYFAKKNINKKFFLILLFK